MDNPAKKRREYLWKKTIFLILTVLGILVAVYGGYSTVYVTVFGTSYPSLFRPESWVSITILIGTGGVLVVRLSNKHLKSLPYVPPVRKQLAEQIAALPAEAILVRGSDQPTASPDELVRATTSTTETPANELLRAEQAIQD